MRGLDSVSGGGSLRPGSVALVVLLIGLLLSVSPIATWLERASYDLLARISDRPASRDIVLVDTRELGRPGDSMWESEKFPDLLDALRAAGARLVLPLDPAPANSSLPDAKQLLTLAEIEQRSRLDGPPAAAENRADNFARQLAAMRHRADLHARTVAAARAMGNILTAVSTLDGTRSGAGGTCDKHLLAPGAAPSDAAVRRIRGVATPSDSLCDASLGSGHAEFWPDDDGVVRRADLVISASGHLVPSVALRAASQFGAIAADTPDLPIANASPALLRYYSGRSALDAFEAMTADELMRDSAAQRRISGRIVILGNREARTGEPGYMTPVAARASPALLMATALSNLLQSDFIARHGWLSAVEVTTMVVIGLVALAWATHAPAALALMAGLIVAVLLLATEAFLVIAHGTWIQLTTTAAFTIVTVAALITLRADRRLPTSAATKPHDTSEPAGGHVVARRDDELDMAFSMLRHQPASENVKERLYELALEHARRRDLAKAERVLRHLAGLDPAYRNAGDKLKKLAGMRQATAPTRPEPVPKARSEKPSPGHTTEDLSGWTIGRYHIERPIGRGAMATVYLGRDPKINRHVAIKTIALAEEFSDSDLANARAQFLREAESAGRLNHPDIISIYDAGEDGAVAYLAMEYFAGRPLSHYTQPGELLPPEKVLELLARAADALHYAHGQHVVHRDVKPANLLYDIDSDTLKITDFGIARLTDTSRTKTGIILGTPSYMSPEQLAGTGVTGQSDLFSLGITAYQLLAGAPPFRADSIPKLMQKIAHDRHAPICDLRPELPACVDELLERALAKNPADRFPNGRAMALALRSCCSSLSRSPAVATT